ncbi:MAG TPA: hypothetical protein VFA27_16035 [Vicinamibacterales bacterium]|nr:hypothetical protein [Vicinamibacterales bacterium]
MRRSVLLLALIGVLQPHSAGAQDAVPVAFVGSGDGYKLTRLTSAAGYASADAAPAGV